ncbi:DoxX family protein [Gordonia liuliyuniae]|uniref:DoxX family protein n=1 Tax=Gordonia liuliyuniae TaxID=2911517 RepID=A0ABS9IWL0_9ACTN|nr:DoxX family protein [Gordonia liuliyuniae]MCF8589539.1 DoxX family protein [Gordonia liuliyuniae]MCF8589949.1 DoxX family protein [Gordonia liuliyuniae]
MSSSNDNDRDPDGGVPRQRPRRPRPDRDDFIEQHGVERRRRPAPDPQPAEDAAEVTDAIDAGEPTSLIEHASSPADDNDTAVIERVDDDEVERFEEVREVEDVREVEESETTRLPRSAIPVRSSDEPVTTEPFEDFDDEVDRPRGERRTAEHLTQDPLPYIEPQPTLPIEDPAPETESFSGASLSGERFSDDPVDGPVAEPVAPARRGTVDLGLLILRLALGGVFLVHGLQKLTGWMNGPGPDGFADYLAHSSDPSLGFDEKVTKALSLVAGVSETAGGVLLILGLLTPIAGAAVLSSILVAMTYKATLAGGVWFFASDGDHNGIEFEVMLAAAAAAVILTGPGLYSMDRRWGWARRPAWGSAVWLIIGIGVAVAVWIVFNGANPLVTS